MRSPRISIFDTKVRGVLLLLILASIVPACGSSPCDCPAPGVSRIPILTVVPGSLSFGGSASGPNPLSQQLQVSNPTGAASTLEWTVTCDKPWVQFSPLSGTTLTETDALTVAPIVSQPEAWGATTEVSNAPTGREDGSAVWTGKELIIWGGKDSTGTQVNTGARYDAAKDQWTSSTSTVGAPSPRWGHRAVWTGREMIVWGGGNGSLEGDGYRYDPAENKWSGPISSVGAPSPRRVHAAVWTGNEMIVWGGLTQTGADNTGARYDPGTDTWTPVSMVGAPGVMSYHVAVWTGTEMLILGGGPSGGRYNPATNSWGTPISVVGAPDRNNACTVWTGSEVIVWSGWDGSTQPNTGGRYNLATDTWQAMTTMGAPVGRRSGTAIWTGMDMIIWGGFDGAIYQNVGQRYRPPIALTPGSYSATLTVSDPNAPNSPQTVDITLTLSP